MIYETIEELMIKAQAAEGKTFGEIDNTGRIKKPPIKRDARQHHRGELFRL
jgi:hypothetical protein